MATPPPPTANEVLHLFGQALSQGPDSAEQASILSEIRRAIERDPSISTALYSTILSVAPRASYVLKRWIADVVEFVVARLAIVSNALSPDQRVHMTIQSIDTILLFLENADLDIQKLGIQCFATAYPVVFRHACGSGSDLRQWEKAVRGKTIVLNAWRTGKTGSKVAAIKAVQKIIQTQTRGSADPRVQNRGDINIGMCPSHHPYLNRQQLEDEGSRLLDETLGMLYSSPIPDVISAIINIFTILAKARPSLGQRIVGALTAWTPNTINHLSATQVKSVEKTIRLALVHLLRSGHGNAFAAQINDFMHRQDQRMRVAFEMEHRRKEQEASLKRARITEETSIPDVIKRQRLDTSVRDTPTPPLAATNMTSINYAANMVTVPQEVLRQTTAAIRNAFSAAGLETRPGIAQFDITNLAGPLMLELVVANLEVIEMERLNAAIEAVREKLGPDGGVPLAAGDETNAMAVPGEEAVALDPLKVEMDEDDLESRAKDAEAGYKQTKANLAAAEAEGAVETASVMSDPAEEGDGGLGDDPLESIISAASSRKLSEKARSRLLHSAVRRICAVGISSTAAVQAGGGDKDLWIQLISRLVTRGMVEEDGVESEDEAVAKEKNLIRKQIFDFVTADIGERVDRARLWLNEEWYADTQDTTAARDGSRTGELRTVAEDSPYAFWLRQLIDFISTNTIDKERGTAFTQFIVDLPQIPKSELRRLSRMCTEPSGMKIGFITLRDLAMLRPPLRSDAMDVLLALCTHTDKPSRSTAILTIKRWVPDVQPFAQMGLDFALHLLHRLCSSPSTQSVSSVNGRTETPAEQDGTPGATPLPASTAPAEVHAAQVDENPNMKVEEESAPMAIVEAGKVAGGLPMAKTEADVARHIELLLGLVSKAPELLDELLKAYPKMPSHVQEAVQNLFTPLIRSLGSSHPKILAVISDYPAGSEDLILKILNILSDKGKLPPPLTSLLKSLAHDKDDINPRFITPIIAEFDKAEIMRHLPRIISLLCGRQAEKDLIRAVFQSVVTTPPTTFGSVSTNMPRVRQSELLTPVELLVLIHLSEREIGIKQSIEAIGICFSMTEAFRPEVLGAFMQQIVDETTLPTLFLRTVIQAVTTYKSLQPYVSNTLLSRLITKKIWTMPQLWQGFIRCAKIIAPSSFGAILQLPREQIRELVSKQPDLRDGLKEYVTKKAGTNRARIQGLLDVLDEAGTGTPPPQTAAAAEAPGAPGGGGTPTPATARSGTA